MQVVNSSMFKDVLCTEPREFMEKKAEYILEHILDRYSPTKGLGHEVSIKINTVKMVTGYMRDEKGNLIRAKIMPSLTGDFVGIYVHDENRHQEKGLIEQRVLREVMDSLSGIVMGAKEMYYAEEAVKNGKNRAY